MLSPGISSWQAGRKPLFGLAAPTSSSVGQELSKRDSSGDVDPLSSLAGGSGCGSPLSGSPGSRTPLTSSSEDKVSSLSFLGATRSAWSVESSVRSMTTVVGPRLLRALLLKKESKGPFPLTSLGPKSCSAGRGHSYSKVFSEASRGAAAGAPSSGFSFGIRFKRLKGRRAIRARKRPMLQSQRMGAPTSRCLGRTVFAGPNFKANKMHKAETGTVAQWGGHLPCTQ